MESIYLGLANKEGYIFSTNDIYGESEQDCAIARINNYCGALIVTAKGDFLIRVKELLKLCLDNIDSDEQGLSIDVAKSIIRSFETEFRNNTLIKENPLPFLLLLVGYNMKNPTNIEHVFVRNRVVKIDENNGKREYTTKFDFQPPVSDANLFYGYSELSQYLAEPLSSHNLDMEALKISAYFSITESQKLDNSLIPGIRMAVLTEEKGFEWVTEEEIHVLSKIAEVEDKKLNRELLRLWSSLG